MRGHLRTIAGLLFAAVLGALLSDRPDLVTLAGVIATIALGGFVVLSVPAVRDRWSWAQTEEDRSRALESALAAYLTGGNEIVQRIAHHPGPPDATLEALTAEGRTWATAVRDLLDRTRPPLVAVFLDDTSGGVEYMSQHSQRDTLQHWMNRRLARLGEVMRRVAQ
jgi:uncharacterized membrane protein YccC